VTADGHKHAVSVQVDTHPTDARPYAVNQVADAFKIDRDQIIDVLRNWPPGRLKAHLEQFNKADLLPPTYRSGR
jgi:hypothetical protein